MSGLARNFTGSQQTENPGGFLEMCKNKQLFIASVSYSFYFSMILSSKDVSFYFTFSCQDTPNRSSTKAKVGLQPLLSNGINVLPFSDSFAKRSSMCVWLELVEL